MALPNSNWSLYYNNGAIGAIKVLPPPPPPAPASEKDLHALYLQVQGIAKNVAALQSALSDLNNIVSNLNAQFQSEEDKVAYELWQINKVVMVPGFAGA